MNLLDVIDKFAKENNLVLCGILLLVAVFVLSFCYKTFWGQWKDRARKKQIYGEPKNRKSHLMREDETNPP